MTDIATPNATLRAVRMGMLMSQDEFAKAIKRAGEEVGQPNAANKRLVQRWEAGISTIPRLDYARALEAVTGLPIESLGFSPAVAMARVTGDGHGGHDVHTSAEGIVPPTPGPTAHPSPRLNYSGIWLSCYEYFSSGRNKMEEAKHFVVLLQHGSRITVRSLQGASTNPDSPLTMDLSLDGNVVTGTWVEQTAKDGYYHGARYHGAIQMLIEPTGTRMVGKWVGFGKDMDTNTGPWELRLQEAATDQKTITKYSRRPE